MTLLEQREQVHAGPCIGGPWAGQGMTHRSTVRPILARAHGSRTAQIVGSYVWHPASREWRWLAIGVPWS
jgi:hypothetical protein